MSSSTSKQTATRHADAQTNKQLHTQTDRQTDGQLHRHTARPINTTLSTQLNGNCNSNENRVVITQRKISPTLTASSVCSKGHSTFWSTRSSEIATSLRRIQLCFSFHEIIKMPSRTMFI